MKLYNLLWKAVYPFLSRHPRLAESHLKRLHPTNLGTADVWIQAASAGEAYLAWSLIKEFTDSRNLRFLVTTNTRQGMDILQLASADIQQSTSSLHVDFEFFPYDMPDIMHRAAARVQPKVAVLLETEIWPGFITALRAKKSRILIINGRIREKSLRRYRIWPAFWKRLKPDRILAVSEIDADRFNQLFGVSVAGVMPNIKFDRFLMPPAPDASKPLPSALVPSDRPFIVLGSVRKEEEKAVGHLVESLLQRHPKPLVALFPRHMERIQYWRTYFSSIGIQVGLRSDIKAEPGRIDVLLWDVFGELQQAYRVADAAFVGGSLAPLGGQNFLEPLSCGVVPIIGPSWSNFHWIGKEIQTSGLLRIGRDWREVNRLLLDALSTKSARFETAQKANAYIQRRKGGTRLAGDLIRNYL